LQIRCPPIINPVYYYTNFHNDTIVSSSSLH
jgi:hypothetical protein